jgi:simple sugar transport system permease protein
MHFHRSHECRILAALIALSVIIGLINPAFFSLSHLFDLLKSSAVMGILAIGVLIVLVSGGIDISFTAVAAVSMYVTSRTLAGSPLGGSVLSAFLMAASIGTGLGLFNALFISLLRLPTLIVTLGTAALFRGMMLAFIGTAVVNSLPPGMVAFSKMSLFQHTPETGHTVGLSISVVVFAGIALCAWWGLRSCPVAASTPWGETQKRRSAAASTWRASGS